MGKQRDLDEWCSLYLLLARQVRHDHPHRALSDIQALARRLLVQRICLAFAEVGSGQRSGGNAIESLLEPGRIYEHCLRYRLVEHGEGIEMAIDQSSRQHTGAYYTPLAVVRFIVAMTVGQAIQAIKDETMQQLRRKQYRKAQATIEQFRRLKVLDIACGGGIFLLEAARLLMEGYDWWNEQLTSVFEHDCEHHRLAFERTGLRYEASPAEVVVQHCVYGIDCDADAVEITRMGLMLLMGSAPAQEGYDVLAAHIVQADALASSFDLDSWLGSGPCPRIIVGNPPWGTPLQCPADMMQRYMLARGQYDVYELFIERATQWLRDGDMLGYVVPDSMLSLPQHRPLRQLLLQSYHIETMVKLGEGVFDGVFRSAVAFSALRRTQLAREHEIRCRIFVKAERQAVMQQGEQGQKGQQGIHRLLVNDGNRIPQARFEQNHNAVFDLFTSRADEGILAALSQHALNWRELFITGRGVEIAKSGAIMACSACGHWQPIARKQKSGNYVGIRCAHAACGGTLHYEACLHETLIAVQQDARYTQAIIVGEYLHRYSVSGRSYLDVSKGPYINYKSPTLYAGEKLLVRKTGRGIYATIDRTGAYTNQVVFIFKLKENRPEAQKDLRLSYVLGVLNSRMMLYRYYKVLGDIEWKSFPYMTQDTIMGLPIRRIDFADAKQAYLHNRIADLVDGVIESGQPPAQCLDDEIELCVRTLYGVETPALSEHIDAELQRIGSYGSLLGSL